MPAAPFLRHTHLGDSFPIFPTIVPQTRNWSWTSFQLCHVRHRTNTIRVPSMIHRRGNGHLTFTHTARRAIRRKCEPPPATNIPCFLRLRTIQAIATPMQNTLPARHRRNKSCCTPSDTRFSIRHLFRQTMIPVLCRNSFRRRSSTSRKMRKSQSGSRHGLHYCYSSHSVPRRISFSTCCRALFSPSVAV